MTGTQRPTSLALQRVCLWPQRFGHGLDTRTPPAAFESPQTHPDGGNRPQHHAYKGFAFLCQNSQTPPEASTVPLQGATRAMSLGGSWRGAAGAYRRVLEHICCGDSCVTALIRRHRMLFNLCNRHQVVRAGRIAKAFKALFNGNPLLSGKLWFVCHNQSKALDTIGRFFLNTSFACSAICRCSSWVPSVVLS